MIDETTEEEFAQLIAGMQVIPSIPEFRLYYDENGRVLFYTCDKPEGNYLVIDSQTYAEARPDIRIIDGVIHKASEFIVVTKLRHSDTGTTCAIEDVSIIVDSNYTGKTQTWKAETHEYKYS
jgi:hypothetical protein